MQYLPTIHVCVFCFWLGIIAVETLIERQRFMGRQETLNAAQYHYQIDVYLEVPAFIILLLTGMMMLDPNQLSGWYLVKVICGVMAVGINAWCVLPVIQRKNAADVGNLGEVIRFSEMIDKALPMGLPFGLAALVLGIIGV